MKYMYALMLMLLFTSCERWFDYHPYDVRIKGETDINTKNIKLIEEKCKDKSRYCINTGGRVLRVLAFFSVVASYSNLSTLNSSAKIDRSVQY